MYTSNDKCTCLWIGPEEGQDLLRECDRCVWLRDNPELGPHRESFYRRGPMLTPALITKICLESLDGQLAFTKKVQDKYRHV